MQHKPQCTNCFIASCKWAGLYSHTPKISTSWFIFQCLLSFLHVVFTVIGTKVNWIEATHTYIVPYFRGCARTVQMHHRGLCTQEGPSGRPSLWSTITRNTRLFFFLIFLNENFHFLPSVSGPYKTITVPPHTKQGSNKLQNTSRKTMYDLK